MTAADLTQLARHEAAHRAKRVTFVYSQTCGPLAGIVVHAGAIERYDGDPDDHPDWFAVEDAVARAWAYYEVHDSDDAFYRRAGRNVCAARGIALDPVTP